MMLTRKRGENVEKKLEFDLKNLKRILELRDKALANMDFISASYYDSALCGCIYYISECYLFKRKNVDLTFTFENNLETILHFFFL